jgi:hypothetical protein
MAQTIVILCDECLEGGTEVPGHTWGLAVEAPGAKVAGYSIDACEMHAEPYRAVLKAVAEYGRRSDRKMPLPRVSGAVTPSAEPVPSGAGEACPVSGCGFVGLALPSHVKAVHGLTISEVLGTANHPCPHDDCDRKFAGPQGVAVHLRTHHGMSVEDARALRQSAGFGARE